LNHHDFEYSQKMVVCWTLIGKRVPQDFLDKMIAHALSGCGLGLCPKVREDREEQKKIAKLKQGVFPKML